MIEDPSYKGMYLDSEIETGTGANKDFIQQKYSVRRCTKLCWELQLKRRWAPSCMSLTLWLVK